MHDFGKVRQHVREPYPRLAILSELEWRLLQLRNASDECESLAFDETVGTWLLVPLLQQRLVIEHVNVRRSAVLLEINHSLRFRRKVVCVLAQGLRHTLAKRVLVEQ